MTEKITVIDSIMGSGKTSWAIQEMDNNPEESYIFCTPFLDEIDRIKDDTKREFCDPLQIDGRKIEGFNRLLESGKDIALTHCTFSNANDETLEYLRQGNYTLILDEVLDILVEFNKVASTKLLKNDPYVLISKKFISVDECGKVTWITDSSKHAAYSEVERLAKSGNLYYLDNAFMVWQFPPQIFGLFKRIFVLTYLFEGSFLKPYFEANGLEYEMVSVAESEDGVHSLVPYTREKEHRERFRELITICDNTDMNNYRATSLSKTWYGNASKDTKKKLRNDIGNFCKNIAKAKSADIMWTAPKEQEKILKGAGYTKIFRITKDMPFVNCPECDAQVPHYRSICPECGCQIKVSKQWLERERRKLEKKSKCFVPCNARATNDYQTRWACAYACNMFPNKYIKRYFENRQKKDSLQIKVNEDYFALSCLLQWVWRSRVRKGEPIHVYIPSTRMRKLFIDWLDGKM